ncbi:hypothetical protein C8J57DRAFT_1561031 [Mycena rebaudengoi]|nr:hypothetical protein C8J57DRAFT_1561031 [Mycena rebaudengoi]
MRETGRNEGGSGGGVECRVVSDEDEETSACTAAPATRVASPSAAAWCCYACCHCFPSPTHPAPPDRPRTAPAPSPSPSPPSASAPAPSSTSIAFPSASYTHGVYRNDTAPLKDAPLPLRAAAAVGVVGCAAVVARSRIRVRRVGAAVAVTTRRRRVPRPRIPHRRLRIPHAALVPSVHPHRHHRKAHIGRGVLRHPADGDACCDSLPMGDGCCECECADEWDSTDDCDCDRAWRPIPIPTPNPPTGDAAYPLPPSIGDGFTPDDIALPGLRYPPPPTPGMEIGIGMRWCWCERDGGVLRIPPILPSPHERLAAHHVFALRRVARFGRVLFVLSLHDAQVVVDVCAWRDHAQVLLLMLAPRVAQIVVTQVARRSEVVLRTPQREARAGVLGRGRAVVVDVDEKGRCGETARRPSARMDGAHAQPQTPTRASNATLRTSDLTRTTRPNASMIHTRSGGRQRHPILARAGRRPARQWQRRRNPAQAGSARPAPEEIK